MVPIPVGLRHIGHLIFTPDDLYAPIITDSFIFHEKGFSRKYLLQPKYLDIYEIGFLSSEANIDAGYKFKGKMKFEFYWKEKLVYEKIATSSHSVFYVNNDNPKIKNVSLSTFEIPLNGKYKNNIYVKVTVLEPDNEIEKYGESIQLYIRVGAVP
jgi:hypothetical protein